MQIEILESLHKIYKLFVSPLLPYHCRFHPTCSEYFVQALKKKGLLRGSLLSFKRILKCNPLFPGGIDAVS